MKWTRHSRHYESEFQQFLNELKREHPDIDQQQDEARSIWWDKPPISLEETARDKMSEVRFKPYA